MSERNSDMQTSRESIQMMKNFLEQSRSVLSEWLSMRLSNLSNDWWQEYVLDKLSEFQRIQVQIKAFSCLESFDLSLLLRVADSNWYRIREDEYMPYEYYEVIRGMISVRNVWTYATEQTMTADIAYRDIQTIIRFFELYSGDRQLIEPAKQMAEYMLNSKSEIDKPKVFLPEDSSASTHVIKLNEIVHLVSDPSVTGVVMSEKLINGTIQYGVFINGVVRPYYEGQIIAAKEESTQAIEIKTLQNALTAYSILNPSNKSLYSLHSARIDFVPYQFRPALKIIQSDSPRLLVADSVGVGKTIEAGLVMKELQARNDIESVLIICPKSLVAERKWELEMNRFDESFTALDGPMLRQVISDTNRDGIWPERYRKAIIPYSLFNAQLLFGGDTKRGRKSKGISLLDLDPPPHFDLVIVDEAHHIRNSETLANASVKYFCDNADAVLFLTATPLQTGNEDLYTLLNTLRPDVVLDTDTFQMMTQPNGYLNNAIRAIRSGDNEWRQMVTTNLSNAAQTQWGAMVIEPDPQYRQVMEDLNDKNSSEDLRLKLIPIIEGFHSFHTMITRTRRQDIQDFCVRRSNTVSIYFTEEQQKLHDELLRFEAMTLSIVHANINVSFMMSMLTRQAASCIFGLAPSIRSLIQRRFAQITDDPEVDIDLSGNEPVFSRSIVDLAQQLLVLADSIPEEDPKFEAFIQLILEKQTQVNNKIIVFSTFRHTLAYLRKKLEAYPIRISQVDGSTKDEVRYNLRKRFEMERENSEAIDLMLFSEVGSEGLDYQFCDMMINYDLPWNPMRIEQRIGRIDRRGQKSEVVHIINMITEGTIDAEIYHRCLWRIGVFENSIGECAEILGEISSKIEEIIKSPGMTAVERNEKLSRMADNEVLQMQEIQKMEENEKHLFGFDFSLISKDLSAAENHWISPTALENLTNNYLHSIIGEGQYILGDGKLKTLRLSAQARRALLPERKNKRTAKSLLQRQWENYLKGEKPNCYITLDSKTAELNRNAFFLTNAHPLVRQAAEYYNENEQLFIGVKTAQGALPAGQYPFLVYAWEYVGYRQQQMLISVSTNHQVQEELFAILQEAFTSPLAVEDFHDDWERLEKQHLALWQEAKKNQQLDAESTYRFRRQSLDYQIASRRRILRQKIQDAYNDNIIRMRNAELENAENKYNHQIMLLKNDLTHSDIHVRLLVSGVLTVEEEQL